MSSVPSSKNLYISVLIVDIAAFLCGTALAWSSPVLAALEKSDVTQIPLNRQITKNEESWIGALSPVGGILGPPMFAYLNQNFGRKWANTLLGLPYLTSYLIAAFAQTFWLFYISRIFMGIGIGGVFTISTTYILEISESSNRGVLCSSMSPFIAAGVLFSNCVGAYTSIMTFNLILSAICVVYIALFTYLCLESPYFSISRNDQDQALNTLQHLRRYTISHGRKEVEEIRLFLEGLQPGSVADVFRTKGSRKALWYSVVLTTFQQFCGINVILFFTQNIFAATGSDLPPAICSIIVSSVQLVSSVMTPLTTNRVGRRGLLCKVSIPGLVLAEFLLGTYFYLQKSNFDVSSLGWLPVTSLILFMAFYNFGMGSLPWVITSEILPRNVVSSAAAMATSFYWFTGFLLTRYFGDLSVLIGMDGSFWLFAGFCVLAWLFTFFVLFETNGKSLNEIQNILNGRS